VIQVLFIVVLAMALAALRSALRARRTYALIGVKAPSYLTSSLLSSLAVALLALANLLGLTARFGLAGLIGSCALSCGALMYAAVKGKPGA
jgi:hypothetical protein